MKDILSSRLKECRKTMGLTQCQVAVYCDITENTYQNYELTAREPKLEILVRIADLFDVSLDYLTGRTDEKRQLLKNKHKDPVKAKVSFFTGSLYLLGYQIYFSSSMSGRFSARLAL